MRSGKRIRLACVACVTVVCVAALGYETYARLWVPYADNYVLSHADPAMASLADEAGMSRTGKLIFLRTQPSLVSDEGMQVACAENTAANNHQGFIEQGCYVPSSNRIYLRKMPDNLHDLEVATAAYEMLHPIYIQLHRSSQSANLDSTIEANFTTINDAHLNEQVANFAKTEPGARDLELFSLLGTGYSDLSAGLTAYYAPYFDSLGSTVSANTRVSRLFQNEQEELAQTNAQITHYDDLASKAYASSVRWANAGSQYWDDYYYAQYKSYITQENTAIDTYNGLLESYNALVTEFNGTQPVKQISPAQAENQ